MPIRKSKTESKDRAAIDLRRLGGAVFDLDGVLADTAATHEAAWREALAEGVDGPLLTTAEYREHIDGKAREAGALAILEARGAEAGEDAVATLCGRKNALFLRRLDDIPPKALAGSRALLDRLRAAGVPLGLFTASRNARQVLRALGEEDRFDALIDGNVAGERGLASKPAPDLPLACARGLGAEPGSCAFFEDAIAGVKAGRAGGFHPVIGIGDGAHAEALLGAGADAVAACLAEVTVKE